MSVWYRFEYHTPKGRENPEQALRVLNRETELTCHLDRVRRERSETSKKRSGRLVSFDISKIILYI